MAASSENSWVSINQQVIMQSIFGTLSSVKLGRSSSINPQNPQTLPKMDTLHGIPSLLHPNNPVCGSMCLHLMTPTNSYTSSLVWSSKCRDWHRPIFRVHTPFRTQARGTCSECTCARVSTLRFRSRRCVSSPKGVGKCFAGVTSSRDGAGPVGSYQRRCPSWGVLNG